VILKLITADDCIRMVEVGDKTPPPLFRTALRYPLEDATKYMRDAEIHRMQPMCINTRQYRFEHRLSADLYEYREVEQ
jgi:hypothetical protein